MCETYKLKELQIHAVTVGGVLYSFYVTLLEVITTVHFKSDFITVIEWKCSICMLIWERLLIEANAASKVCSERCWLGVYKIFRFYQFHFFDRLSVVVSLISFSLLVWLGDYIGGIIKWNLVGVFLIVQVAYIALRMYAESRNM